MTDYYQLLTAEVLSFHYGFKIEKQWSCNDINVCDKIFTTYTCICCFIFLAFHISN